MRSLTVSILGRSGVLALLLTTTYAAAATTCAQDAAALKTADMQQFLMVAALTCHKVDAYNGFVLSHRGELQQSDKALLSYFMGRSARTGDDDYNAFKTSLANAASLRSLHDPLFCASADTAFAASAGRTVTQLIAEQPVPIKLVYPGCSGTAERREAALDSR
jgi:hypothetical protein